MSQKDDYLKWFFSQLTLLLYSFTRDLSTKYVFDSLLPIAVHISFIKTLVWRQLLAKSAGTSFNQDFEALAC